MKKQESVFVPRDSKSYTVNAGILGRVDPVVLIISAILLVGFTAWGVVDNKGLGLAMSGMLNWTLTYTGFMYMGGVFFILCLCLYLAFSKYGRIKLGKPEDKPEFSDFSWFSMLVGIGMGIGLIFWSVAEPLYHYYSGPTYAGTPGSPGAAEWSMAIAFFHWGLSAWCVYVIVAIVMGLVIHKKGLPSLISSSFYPILGDKIYGPIGKAIDILSVIATFFGVCTTIGLGTMQLASGLNFNYGIAINNKLYAILLVFVAAGYIASACLPVSKGIQTGSNISMLACFALMGYLFLAGPTKFILDNFVNASGIYLQNMVMMSLWMDPIQKTGWLGGWTIFYWAWWIAWTPCVGLFMAKISKGRTIKEVVLFGLFLPTIFCMVFIDIFGSTALSFELDPATTGVIWGAIQESTSKGLYTLFQQFPGIVIVVPVLLFVSYTFFVVTVDASCIVLGTMVTGGDENPKTALKILWGITLAVAAAVLLAMGGLNALQTANIVAAFPFLLIILCMCYAFFKMVKEDVAAELAGGAAVFELADHADISRAAMASEK